MAINTNKRYFSKALLKWNEEANDREMPWKGEKDPYKIWLSEIILQQTRVDQGLNYYNRFVKTFPTINQLAKAPETKVFKLWEGLGYYSRCKNLIATAKYISTELKGKFPDKYEDILSLKGVGPYTAAAIGSFAFNLPHAVVDGNVFRVLSRYFNIDTPIDSNDGKKIFTQLADDLLDKKLPGIYNQALMDFGATVCKPQQPLCGECVLRSACEAYLKGTVNLLPIKEKSIIKKERWLYYFIIEHKGKVFVRKRPANDIWENLYEFVLLENNSALSEEELQSSTYLKKKIGEAFKIIQISKEHRQLLTHQTIKGRFIHVELGKPLPLEGYYTVSKAEIKKLPFPKFITLYLKDKNVSLNL
ncbi:A/G-specific adenine glycosylase [Ferruginibacter lapsinanis]|nr:A/G-specific adenine glycosylase [Ferruginibacter lapsinanis]UEG51330.1 A/G-specific adenine glycosylase [Ferruginibacter lapsinanis]